MRVLITKKTDTKLKFAYLGPKSAKNKMVYVIFVFFSRKVECRSNTWYPCLLAVYEGADHDKK
jgi:hypothetical protein